MFTDFYHAFYYPVLLLAAVISMLCYNKVDKTFRRLCLLIVLTAISELIAGYLKSRREHNGIVHTIFTPIEYFMYTLVYQSFFNDKKFTKILFASAAGLVLLLGINMLFFQPATDSPTNIMNIESVLLVILSLKLFTSLREKPVYQNILGEGIFWFNSAVLLYYSFDIFFWGFHDVVFRLKNPPRIIYNGLLLFSGILYLTYAAAVLLNYNAGKKAALAA